MVDQPEVRAKSDFERMFSCGFPPHCLLSDFMISLGGNECRC